jgi:hypothetical protein
MYTVIIRTLASLCPHWTIISFVKRKINDLSSSIDGSFDDTDRLFALKNSIDERTVSL